MRTTGIIVATLVSGIGWGTLTPATAAGSESRFAIAATFMGGAALGQVEAEAGREGGSLPERANREFGAGNFARAEELYAEIVSANPDDAIAWYRLGFSFHAQGKYEEALGAHTRAATFDRVQASALYNLACAQALLERNDEAIGTLERSVDAGFKDWTTMERDSDLESVRTDERFTELLERVRAAGGNGAAPRLRAFDFWVGTWDVFNPQGTLVGKNVIRKLHDGHVIEEKWIGGRSSTGMSMNFYDPGRRAWRQVWVSHRGGVVEYEGGFRDGAMRMEGTHVKPNGTKTLQRVSFTPKEDGSVRQFIEESADGGETWTTYFDGLYVKRTMPLEKEPE